jgi:ATP-dependent Zn protease
MTIEERRSTAIHEAGHVVVAWALGLPVGSMEIGCNGDDTAGRSEIDETARQLSLVDRIALCIAGMEAQLLFGCESIRLHGGSSVIIRMLDDLLEEEADTIRSKGYDRAAELLVCRRPLIERIVERLAISGKLERGEVLALLQEAEQQSSTTSGHR